MVLFLFFPTPDTICSSPTVAKSTHRNNRSRTRFAPEGIPIVNACAGPMRLSCCGGCSRRHGEYCVMATFGGEADGPAELILYDHPG
jgi:hypothetical protein